jgi:hypothetical protein
VDDRHLLNFDKLGSLKLTMNASTINHITSLFLIA